MSESSENLVPKVHPTAREIESDDPMELVANPVQGDPELMLQCLVQEFSWLGWGQEELLEVFKSPMYPVMNQLLAHFGEDGVRRRVEELVGSSGVFSVQETISADPDLEEDEEPELIQLSARLLSEEGRE